MKLDWKTCRRIGVSAFLLFLAIHYWGTVAGFLGLLLGACMPLIIGGVSAYVINILMSFYERLWFPKSVRTAVVKTRRPLCMLLAIVTVAGMLAAVVILVLPELVRCIGALIQRAPAAVEQILSNPAVARLIPADIGERLSSLDWNDLVTHARKILFSGFSGAASAVSSIFSGAVTALFALIFAIYILLGKDRLARQGVRLLHAYLTPRWRERVFYALGVLDRSFHSYVVGQCTEAVILGGLCIGCMTLFRFPYATMIGTLVGVTALIPVAGAYIGAGVGAFMILSVSPGKALWFLVFIVVLQQLEGNLIYPKVVGSSIGLPGIFVLAAVTVGGAMFGVLGMLAGVPLTAALYQAIRDDLTRRGSVQTDNGAHTA